jgi:predicted Ser/Thr protein kinase
LWNGDYQLLMGHRVLNLQLLARRDTRWNLNVKDRVRDGDNSKKGGDSNSKKSSKENGGGKATSAGGSDSDSQRGGDRDANQNGARSRSGGRLQSGSDNIMSVDGSQMTTQGPSQEEFSDRNAITPPRASDVELWHCNLLDALTGVKILSTRCGSRFVKMVRERRMTRAVAEMEREAATYEFVQEQDPNSDAVPAFFGMSDHPGVPLILLSMEGPSFEEIRLENLSNELKKSAVESLRCLATMGILHGDIALRNVVQGKSNQHKAKIVDFGRSSICSDQTLLRGQVDALEYLLTESS